MAVAAGESPRLPDGANHQLPPDILTENGEAEPNRPAEQQLLGIEASTWAADQPPWKHTDAHQHAEHTQLARGDL
jgi:hypothetical protein